jgi:uncharacterized protein YkwD
MPTLVSAPCARRIAVAAAALLAPTAMLLAAAPTEAVAREHCRGTHAAPSAQTLRRAAAAVVCLVNAERARHGVRALRGDQDLRRAAARHARDMVRRGFFSHVTPTGADLGDRLRRTGYIHGRGDTDVGETLAFGTGRPATPTGIVAGWVASPQHHRVLLASAFHVVGVGVAAGVPDPSGRVKGATYTLATGVIDGG